MSRWLVAAATICRAGEYGGETLSANDRLVLLTLSAFMNQHHDGVWPSKRTLARETGLSVRAVRASLAKLERIRLLSRHARFNPGRRDRATDYIELHLPIRAGAFDHEGEWQAED